MFLNGYKMEIFKSKCDANARGVHCFIHLEDDIREVLPYLNTKLGGFVYTQDPPSLSLKHYGKLLTFHSKKIAINALQDNEEAEKIAAWLYREINETWEMRDTIEPSTESASQPTMIEILRLLPRTNCKKCNEPTCMVFATKVIEGAKDGNNCPEISPQNKEKLTNYLTGFKFG
ncbi:MAG: ArsR family metal-binding transcriptional regulator [Desulforhopalus sp.]|jgi:ArsR family metal-binding transcriptional regulator